MLTLFVLADLLCATCVVPVVLGLWVRIHHTAALVGCVVGLLTAFITFGVGIDEDPGNFETLTMAGGLYSDTSFIAFIITPVCSGGATLLFNIPFFLKGYKFEGFVKEKDAADGKEVDIVATSTA